MTFFFAHIQNTIFIDQFIVYAKNKNVLSKFFLNNDFSKVTGIMISILRKLTL